MREQTFDLVVIGGGSVGLTAVQEALTLDCRRIALVEKEDLGGECAHFACVPTKTLLTAARDLEMIREHAPLYGIHAESVVFNFQELMRKKQEIVTEGGYDFLNDPRVTLIRGNGRFISEDTLEVAGQTLRSKRFLVATGSSPKLPDVEGLREGLSGGLCISYREATQLERLPKSIAIIGGGAVGVEFSQAFAVFGGKVTLIEHNPTLLGNEEPEIVQALCDSLRRSGVSILTGASVERVIRVNGHKMVFLKQEGDTFGIEAEVVLCATGTRPNIEGLGLEAAGVAFNERGIVVNDEMRTRNPRIWAAGDVTEGYKFTHVGDYEAEIAVQNALFPGLHQTPDCRAMAWAVFTEPALAHVGLTEARARLEYRNVAVVSAQVSEVSRYRIESAKAGLVKLVIDADTHRLLGGHLLAPEADDLAHMLIVAIHNRLKVQDLVPMFYIYPARAQLIQKALEKYIHALRQREPAHSR